MSKGTSLKEAIKQFETAKSCVAAEAKKARRQTSRFDCTSRPFLARQVELWGRNPPIEKLDATLATLKECRRAARGLRAPPAPLKPPSSLRPFRQTPGAELQQHLQDRVPRGA